MEKLIKAFGNIKGNVNYSVSGDIKRGEKKKCKK